MRPEPNFANRTLFHGDNLGFLQGLNSGSVHLIATDPPFNKGRDFHATPDSLAAGGRFEDRWRYDKDVHPEWIDAIKDDQPVVWSVIDTANEIHKKKGKQKEDGSGMGAFLCYMGVRLMEMHRVLCEEGSLYLHCDTTASHYLKAILDAIFGRKGFRNEIVWKRYGSHNDVTAKYGRVHDNILYYVKSDKAIWTNDAREEYDEEYIEKAYRNEDERGRYTTAPLHGRTLIGGGYEFEWKGITDIWRFPRERLDEMDEQGLIHWPKRGKIPRRKVYLDRTRGIPARDVITDIKTVSQSEDYGYRTQKPLALYERIIRASSNEGDIVLDPFVGCATTVVAAERLGRRWIGMDLWDGAYKAVVQRLLTEGLLSPGGVPDAMRADLTAPRDAQPALGFGELHYATTPPERSGF